MHPRIPIPILDESPDGQSVKPAAGAAANVRLMLGRDQDALLQATLGLLDGNCAAALELPAELANDEARFRRAGFAAGLTAALWTLAGGAGVELPQRWRSYGAEQAQQVTARQARFTALLPTLLNVFASAGVEVLPIKGAVLATEVWPHAGCRPMSDIDLIIAPADRDRASAALIAAGMPRIETHAWEDTFLGWGDGSVGRTDGESADHNGKIEVHPGWVERLHNYLIHDGGLLIATARPGLLAGQPALRLDPGAFAVQVVGHLAATVVRCEVRAVNVLDVLLCLRQLDAQGWESFASLARQLDPRLVAPGLWLLQQHRPDAVDEDLTAELWARLGGRAQSRLEGTPREAVLRDPTRRTTIRWRSAFAINPSETLAMVRQAFAPPKADLERGTTEHGLRLHARRLGRAVSRAR